MPRLWANRFAVPAGRIAIVASEPTSASAHCCTMPSPPQTNTRSAPSLSALRTFARRLLLLGTSYQSSSSTRSRGDQRAQFVETAAQRLAGVGDDRDPADVRLPVARRSGGRRLVLLLRDVVTCPLYPGTPPAIRAAPNPVN